MHTGFKKGLNIEFFGGDAKIFYNVDENYCMPLTTKELESAVELYLNSHISESVQAPESDRKAYVNYITKKQLNAYPKLKGEVMKKAIRPSYYKDGRQFEPKDVIRDWDLNFNLGNVLKYISRAGRKTSDRLNDLIKAKTYLEFEIEVLEKEDEKEFEEVCANLKEF